MRLIPLFLVFTLLITPSCRVKEETKTSESTERAATQIVDQKILDIQKVVSPDGLTAWLVEDKSLPVLSLKFSFKGAGSIQDAPEKQGTAQLLSNTMDEGAGDLTSQEFQKQLSDHSITLYFNSGRDNFGGQLKTLLRHQDKAFDLLRLALTKPRFDPEPVERMRRSNLSRIRNSMGDPDWIAARIFNDRAFSGHPYALNSGGTLSSLPRITPEDLKNHVANYLTKDRLRIAVTGNITAQELAPLLDQIFGDLPTSAQDNQLEELDLQNKSQTFLYKKDIPQTILQAALPSFDRLDPDYYALRLMNHIFGAGGFGSRLMEEAREKRGLTYGIYSQIYALDKFDGLLISTSTKNDSVEDMRQIINTELQRMANEPVSALELQNAKNYITGSMPLALTSTDKISGILLGLQLNDRPIDYLDQFVKNIDRVMEVDIQRVAQRVLNEEKLLTILVGNPENISDTTLIEKLPNVE